MATSNKFGGEFDSAADHFSQGVAPAVIVFAAYRMADHEILGLIVMSALVATASIRNARFYVDKFNNPLTWCGLPRTISGMPRRFAIIAARQLARWWYP